MLIFAVGFGSYHWMGLTELSTRHLSTSGSMLKMHEFSIGMAIFKRNVIQHMYALLDTPIVIPVRRLLDDKRAEVN